MSGNPSGGNRAAKLREIAFFGPPWRGPTLADAPNRGVIVQVTRHIGDALLWPGGVKRVRSADFEVRSAEFISANAIENPQLHAIRPSP